MAWECYEREGAGEKVRFSDVNAKQLVLDILENCLRFKDERKIAKTAAATGAGVGAGAVGIEWHSWREGFCMRVSIYKYVCMCMLKVGGEMKNYRKFVGWWKIGKEVHL